MGDNLNEYYLVYQNIRSLRRNSDKLLAYIDTSDTKPLIIGLSEIWIYENEIDDYSLDGYNLFANCNKDSRSGGVAMYAKNSLNCKQLNFKFSSFDAVGITFTLSSKLICAVCIYRLSYTNIPTFIEEFSKLLIGLSHTNLLIGGDFNIDFLQTNSFLDSLLILLSNNGLDVLVSEPTRTTDLSATCIDNALYRFDQRYFQEASCSVLDLRISDHCLLEIKLTGPAQCTIPSRNIEVVHVDYTLLTELLITEEWRDVYNCMDASTCFDEFLNIFIGHINKCTTLYSLKNKLVKLKPWMSKSLLKLIRKRNKICLLVKKHPNNKRLKTYSLKLCDEVNQNISMNKTQFYAQQFSSNGKDARKNWKTVNEIITGRKESGLIKEIIDQKSCKIHGPVEIANVFNEYFTQIGGSNRSNFQLSNTEKNRLITDHYDLTNSFLFAPISSGELYVIINSLKNRSTPGFDGLSNVIIKRMSCFLVDVLSFIFNLSEETGIFPTALKRAIVVPIFKKDDRSCLNNYRPISLLSVFSKIFEKAMKTRFVSFLDNYNILSPVQFGFRKHKNTEQAILSFLEHVSMNIDQGLKASALFVDLTKAFDRVEHSTLLLKLYCCGFRGTIHKWFCSYLTDRTQVVKVNGHLSKILPINIGVPQGSVLGPLLFLIYINGIFDQQFYGSPIAFADDISFSYAGTTIQDNTISIEHDLNLMSSWLKAHNFLLSEKSKILHFRNRRSSPLAINFHEFGCNKISSCGSNGCFVVSLVLDYRYLGILIDDNLNWKPHIEGLKSRLLLVSRKMYALRLYCPQHLLRMVYFALAESILQYGLSCWGCACRTTIQPLLVRQKHIARIMYFKEMRSPSWPTFQQLEILPLRHLFVFKVLRIFYVISGNTFVSYSDYSLRSNFQFKKIVPKFNSDLRRSFFNVVAPIIFNNLPCDIRMCSTLSSFSKALKLWLTQTKDIEQLFRTCL